MATKNERISYYKANQRKVGSLYDKLRKKEDKVLEKIVNAVEKLDTDLDKIDTLSEDADKNYEVRK